MTETDIKAYKPLTVRIAASDKPNSPLLIVSADTPQELELNLLAIEENTTGATIGRLEEIIRAQYNLGAGLGARGMEAPQNPVAQQPEPAQQAPAQQAFPPAQPQQQQAPNGFPTQQGFPPAQQAQQQPQVQQQAPAFPAPQQDAQGFTQFPTNETSPEWGSPNPAAFPTQPQQQGFPQQQQQQAPAPQQQQAAPQQQAPKQGGGFLGQEPPAPGAPMLAGVGPAKLVKPQDPTKTWAAWADPRPREVTDLIQAKTDDPNDPRLAAGTAKFWAFIQTRR